MNLVSKSSRVYWAVLLLVTALSLYMNATAVATTTINQLMRADSKEYLAYVFNLFLHGVYAGGEVTATPPEPDAIRSPGYVFFVSPLMDLSRPDFGVNSVLYTQAFLGALTTLFSMLIFARIMPVFMVGCCGILVAISPHLINANVYFLTESLFTFLLVSHVSALILAKEKENLPLYLLSGTLLAASWLVRPTTILLAFAYLIFFGLAFFKNQLDRRALAFLVLPFFFAFSAWGLRNEVQTDSMSDPLLTKQFIEHGSYINLMYQDRPETYGYPYNYDPVDVNTVGEAIALVVEHFKAEPFRYIYWTLIGKPITFLRWNNTEGIGDAFIYEPLESPYLTDQFFILSHDLSMAIHTPLMALAVLGSLYFLVARASFALKVCSIIVVYFIGFHMLGAPFPRYSIPIRPFCYGMAACALYQVYLLRGFTRKTF